MIPGMTSKGGILPEVPAYSFIAIQCEGMQHALGIGRTTMSKAQMQKVGKGIGLELIAHVGDDNWNIK
jgi:PUA domain protein